MARLFQGPLVANVGGFSLAEYADNCAKLDACENVGIVPKIQPIRGGTDGARLSFMGLPCPNLGTGGYAFHGPYEHITVEGMDKSVEILMELVKIYGIIKKE